MIATRETLLCAVAQARIDFLGEIRRREVPDRQNATDRSARNILIAFGVVILLLFVLAFAAGLSEG